MTPEKQVLQSVREVFEAFGGPTALTEWAKNNVPDASISKSAVSNWASEGWIPPAWYVAISTELAERGYEVDPKVFRQLPVKTDA
jgi:hypothetical protein